MAAASALGQQMALTEPEVIPQLRLLDDHTGFVDFQLLHRHTLEQIRPFAAWDEKLRELMDLEGRARGLNLEDAAQWDDFYQYISVPMRASFWWRWEQLWHLRDIYDRWQLMAKQKAAENASRQAFFRAFIVDLKQHVEGEKDPWEALTHRLFEQGDQDEALWELPQAEKLAAKDDQPVAK